MTNALEVKGLRKSYGEKVVLKGIDLYVRRGDIFALLGVNGAGKTTTLECIEGLRKYDGGTISVNGRIGIQLQSAALPAHIKGAEAVRLFAKWNRKTADVSMLAALGVDGSAPGGALPTGQAPVSRAGGPLVLPVPQRRAGPVRPVRRSGGS